jgi:hypothetical protein
MKNERFVFANRSLKTSRLALEAHPAKGTRDEGKRREEIQAEYKPKALCRHREDMEEQSGEVHKAGGGN